MRSGWWSPASASNQITQSLADQASRRDSVCKNLNTVLRAIPRRTPTPWRGHSNTSTACSSPRQLPGVWRRWRCSWRGMPGLGGQPPGGEKGLAGDVRRPWSVETKGCGDFAEGGHRHPGGKYDPRHHRRLRARRPGRGGCMVMSVSMANSPAWVNMRVARGCGNIARGPAMSREQGQELLLEVMQHRALAQEGVTLFGVDGQLGILTTPAAADRQRFDRQRCAGRWSGLAPICRWRRLATR